jgi:hypothetical protein
MIAAFFLGAISRFSLQSFYFLKKKIKRISTSIGANHYSIEIYEK